MSRRAGIFAALIVSAALAGCGGGSHSTSVAAFRSYSGPGYTIKVPKGLESFTAHGVTGRVATEWTTAGTNPNSRGFRISATYDPHPATLRQVIVADLAGQQESLHPNKSDVEKTAVSGAQAAVLITDSAPHGAGAWHNLTQQDQELIVTTSQGALIDLLVVAHGNWGNTASTVIRSFKLAR